MRKISCLWIGWFLCCGIFACGTLSAEPSPLRTRLWTPQFILSGHWSTFVSDARARLICRQAFFSALNFSNFLVVIQDLEKLVAQGENERETILQILKRMRIRIESKAREDAITCQVACQAFQNSQYVEKLMETPAKLLPGHQR